jgi:hypothetical protein
MNCKKIASMPVFITLFAIIALTVCGCGESYKSVDNTLSQIAAEANKDLPLMIDAQTRLDSITALPGRKIQYNNTLTVAINEEIDIENFRQLTDRTLAAAVKNNPSLESYRKKKVTFIYVYHDKSGKETAAFEYAPQDYK